MNAFSIRLKQAMNKEHMKQVDLCNSTGILKSLISGYVNGSFYPKRDNLTLIAKALNVTPKWLLFGDESEYQHENKSEIFITLDGKLLRSIISTETETIKGNTGKNEVDRMSKTNISPKLIITSDGENTQAILGGVHIGKGISDLEFSARGENGRPTLNLLGINIDDVEFEPADTYLQSMKKFAEMLEEDTNQSN